MTSRRFGSRPSFDGQLVVLDNDARLNPGDYSFQASEPGTVWTIEHHLGFDPAGLVVVDADGYQRDGFGVQYLVAGQSLRLSFDVALAGTAYLS